MKEADLRIGSNYKAPIEFFKGSVVHKLNAKDEEFTLTKASMVLLFQLDLLQFVQPIPISEELLLKFGFEKLSHVSFRKVNGELNWQLVLSDSGKGFYTTAAITQNPITHVHQLQNLYYILTGEELTQTDS